MKNETTVTEQPCTLHTVVCCACFTKQDWYSFAGIIDNNFFYDFEKFTAERENGYYLLNTNRCDSCSIARVYSNNEGITKITRVCDDTEGWDEIQPNTYERLNRFLLDRG